MGGAPTTRTWRGVTVDPTTADALDEAARLVGNDIYLTPLQGCYTSSTSASSGTHDGGGAVDIDCTALTVAQAVRVETTLRRVGFAAWRRPATSYWRHHVHALRQDCTDLSPNAHTQVGDYRAGYSGIPIGGRVIKDTGTRAYVTVTWGTYRATQEADMQLTDTVHLNTGGDVKYSSPTTNVEGILASTNYYVLQLRNQMNAQLEAQSTQVAALTAAVQALSTAAGVDPTQVQQILSDAVDKALADLRITRDAPPAA